MENAETAETAEGPAPAPTAEGPVPAPAPAATLEQPHSKNKEKFSVETLGDQPVHIVTFTYGHYFNLDEWIPSTTLTLCETCKYSHF